MAASVKLGFKDIILIPFSDANFTKDTGNQQVITTSMLMGDTPITVTLTDQIEKRPFADGSIFTFTGVNTNPGTITFTLGKTEGIDDILQLLFPESYKLTNGSNANITSRAYTKPIGSDRSSWEKALFCRLAKPSDNTDQSEWVEGRCAVETNYSGTFGADITKLTVTLSLIGGETLSNGETVVLRVGDPDSGNTVP